MPANIYFAATANWSEFETLLPAALKKAGIDAAIRTEPGNPAEVDYIIYAPTAPLQDFSPFTRCKAVLSLWAGVERIVSNQTLTQPLCRMVDDGLTEGMVEYVVGQALRFHLGTDRHIHNPGHDWEQVCPPLARERPVTVLGAGVLGAACARALMALNFPVTVWSRSGTEVAGARCLAGADGLDAALRGAEIVITLLPRTPETENILDARRLALLAKGAAVINPGRGALIDDAALLAALDAGQVGHATLDVFRIEPLPKDHPYWSRPNVTVTPHVAADTRPGGASLCLAENIRRGEAGLPFLHLVDRARGY